MYLPEAELFMLFYSSPKQAHLGSHLWDSAYKKSFNANKQEIQKHTYTLLNPLSLLEIKIYAQGQASCFTLYMSTLVNNWFLQSTLKLKVNPNAPQYT